MKNDDHTKQAEPCTLKKVAAALFVFYLVALLLNAEGLLRNARRMPYGRLHDVGVALAEPVAALSRSLGLTALRTYVECWINAKTKGTRDE